MGRRALRLNCCWLCHIRFEQTQHVVQLIQAAEKKCLGHMHRSVWLHSLGRLSKRGSINRLPVAGRCLKQDIDTRSVGPIWIDGVQHCLKLFICPVRYWNAHPLGSEIDLNWRCYRRYSRLPNFVNGEGRHGTDEGNPQDGKGCFHSAGLTPCLRIGKHKIFGAVAIRQTLSG